MKTMRVAIDATCWHNNRGYGRHARALVSTLIRRYPENEYRLFLDSAGNTPDLAGHAKLELVAADTPASSAASSNGHRSLADMWRMSRALSKARVDVLLYPTIYTYVPALTSARKLVMIHDVIAETYPNLTLPRRTARLFWKAKVALGRMQADALVTVSEFSREKIIEYFRVAPERVFVVSEAADPVFRILEQPAMPASLRALGIGSNRRIVVYVGGFSPHKNLEELMDAFSRIASLEQFADCLLVLVGETRKEVFHSCLPALRGKVDQAGLRERVVFPGYVSDEDLAKLLNLSAVLVLPSFMEGFGLPAVEAAACGCPVIATKASPLPQLLEGGGIYIEPGSGQLEPALEAVLASKEMRERMRRAGAAAAQRLTWNAAAEQLMRVMQSFE